jgi:hypothetical protein
VKRGPLVAFLGPSLPAREARRIARGCVVLPPARQGDVWRALLLRPRAIALIDGVFESQPSVWHHELLAALASGTRVVGGASMGALRAAELHGQGVEGAGRIFRWYRDGTLRDDAEVALLHASAEHGFRALTVPLVNVRWAAQAARKARVLRPAEARALVAAAEAIFYQERSWQRVVAAAQERWSKRARAGWARLAGRGLPDLKADDARATLLRAARDLPAPRVREPARPSSLVRRRRILEGASRIGGARAGDAALVASSAIVFALRSRADAAALADAGLRRLLLAALARSLGLRATADERAAAEARWLGSLHVGPAQRESFLSAAGLAEDEARALCEELALEQLALDSAERLFADGPSRDEALALEARVRGHWSALARELASRRRR